MVSRENTVTGACILAGFVVGLAISEYTSLSPWIALAAFVILAIVLPIPITFYFGRN